MDGGNNLCSKCQKIPSIESGSKKVFLIFPIPLLKEKFNRVAHNLGYQCSQDRELTIINVPNFKKFIKDLYDSSEFSLPESNDILCLALEESEDFHFLSYFKIKPLLTWFSMLEAEEYLDIIRENRLTIHFHPVIDSKTLKIYGYECLIRGISNSGDLVPPLTLFDLAEKTDTLFYLDRTCREIAVKTASEKGLRDYKVFINFVPSSIYDPQACLQTTIQVAKEQSIDPHNLVFEVVESQKIKDIKHLSKIVDYYRSHGFMVALDDMGTGYASLEVLINLRPDLVKIDKEIIRNISKDSLKQSIFRGIIRICEETKILKVAEGIETEDEYNYVKDYVELVQGFLFSKPNSEPSNEEEVVKNLRPNLFF
ncbi:MAG: EAL domain-containing protein [Syntrophobacterales bacterium]|nr:EAL domain-containing protein [Syntrophobacterales bacterium]